MRILISLSLLVFIVGCHREPAGGGTAGGGTAQATGAGSAPKPRGPLKDYPLEGTVREVDLPGQSVRIDHKAIPGFMAAMEMDFPVKDEAALRALHPGDEVEGTLRVEMEGDEVRDYELVGVHARRPTPEPLTVDLSSGLPKLRPRQPVLETGQEVPDVAMTTQEGTTLHLSDLKGKVVVLTFIYTRCPLPDFCPLMDRKFAELAGKLGAVARRADQVRLLSISFDPEHDTPEVLRRHAQRQGARPPLWTYAVATHDELRKVAEPLGLMYGPTRNEIAHNLCTAIIDPRGRLVRLDRGAAGKAWTPSAYFQVISSLLSPSRK